MNAFVRFISLGLQDADRRIAAVLSPPRLDETDRYLRESRVVSAIDRVTVRLHDWWTASAASRVSRNLSRGFAGRTQADRYQSIAVAVFTAVGVHVALMLAQGPGVGWFRMLIPSIAAAFALLLAAYSRVAR